jgi:hypothetical protein
MPVSVEWLSGSPKYSGSRDSLSVTLECKIDWGDIDDLYLELFPAAVGSKPSLPALFPGSTVLYADSFEAEPFVGSDDVPTCSVNIPTYDSAKVTITYKTIPYSQGEGASDQIITRNWSLSGDVLVLPSHGVRWKVGAVVVNDPDVRAGLIIPMSDLKVTLHRVTSAYFESLRDTVNELRGTVNDAAFEGCAAETLLLLGGDFTQTVSADGSQTYQCELTFQHRVVNDAAGNPQGWNYFYRPDTGAFEELETKDGDPIYWTGDFTDLYT